MWKCRTCDAEVDDDNWDTCWKCSTPKDCSESESRKIRERIEKGMSCLRCEGRMKYAGTRQFHEGSRIGFLGDFAELFVSRERFDVYVCPLCGKVEFFADGIGDEKRGESEAV